MRNEPALVIPDPVRQRQARASDPNIGLGLRNAGSGKTHVLTTARASAAAQWNAARAILCSLTPSGGANMADRVFTKLAL